MKILYLYLTCILLFSCSQEEEKKSTNEVGNKDNTIKPESATLDSNIESPCPFDLDTIANEKYKYHVWILNILCGKDKHALDDQMIAVFLQSLDPYENENYQRLTNKVIFSLLEKQSETFADNYNLELVLLNNLYIHWHLENP